jgi:TP901 family phage tail tape measure protein
MAATINYVLGVNTSQAQRQVQNLHNNAQSLFSRGINVVLNNRFSGPLGRITGDVKQFDKSLDAATARVLAFSSTTSILYAVGSAMKRLVGDAVAVEAALAKIQAISFSSSSSMKLFGDELFKIANKTSQSFADVAAAAEEFSRQGLSTAETLKAVSAASVLAKLSGTSLASSIEGLVGIMQTFSAQALEYKDVVSLLTSVDAQFATSAAGLVDGLKRVSSVAADAGLTLQDTAAAIASVRQLTGRSEAVIGNGLKTIITNFRTEAVGKQLENIGVYTKDAQGNFRDLTSVIGEVQEAFSKLSSQAVEDISLKIAGKYQINNLKALLKSFKDAGNGQGSLFEKAQKSANPDDNLTQKRVDILTNTTESRIKKLDNDFTQLGANLGANLLKPAFDKTIDFISSITGLFNKLDTVAGPVLRGIADVLSGPTLLLGATVLGTLFFKLAREVGGVLAGLLNINKADERILSTQQLINDALVAADRTIVDQIRNATTLEAKYEAINRLVAQFIAQQNRNGGYSQGLYSTGSTIRTSGGGNGGGGGGGGGVAGAGGGVNYYGGAGGGGFTRYAPGSIITSVNGQLPTTRTVNGNSIPAPITNPAVLYAGSTGRNGTAQTPFNTRTGRDIRPELINVPGEQKASTGLLAASLLTPLATGFASAFLRKTDSNGQSRETKGSQLVSDLGQSASSGLTTAFLATSFRTFSRFAGPLGLAVSAAQGLNSLGNFKSNALKGNLEDIGLNSEKKDKSIAALREYSGLTTEIRDAKAQGIPLYKIRGLENKRNSLLGDISSDNAFGRSDSKLSIDRALNQDDQERALARAEATAYKRTSGTDITTTLLDTQKKAYGKLGFLNFGRRISASNNFKKVLYNTNQYVDSSDRYSFDEFGGQNTVDSFSAFAKKIDPSTLVKGGKETTFGNYVNEQVKSNSFSNIDTKGIAFQLKTAGYGNAGKAFDILNQGDTKVFEESLKAFFYALQDSIAEAKKTVADPKEVEKRNKKVRKEIVERNYEIEKSYQVNAIKNQSTGSRQDFIINANKAILESRNQNAQISPEEYNKENLINESKSISSDVAKNIRNVNEEYRKKFEDSLVKGIDEAGIDINARNSLMSRFQEFGASNKVVDSFVTELIAKNGKDKDLLDKNARPLKEILSSQALSVNNLQNNGSQALLEATLKYQLQDEQNKIIRRKERESALSPFGDNIITNLSTTNSDINTGARVKTGEFLKNAVLQKTTSELLNKPEYSFSDAEKKLDEARKESQTKRSALAAISSAKDNYSFIPLGANATQEERDRQNADKTRYRDNIESLLQQSGRIDIKERALGSLGRTFEELQSYQKENSGKGYSFGRPDLQRQIAERISKQDYTGASSLLSPELDTVRSQKFQDKFKGTSYGQNIEIFLQNLNNVIERAKQETSLNPEVAKIESEKIINRNAGDKTDPNNTQLKSIEELLNKLDAVSKKIAEGAVQKVDAKVEMIVGVNFDKDQIFNNESFKANFSSLVSSTVKSYLEANNPTGTPPVTPPSSP